MLPLNAQITYTAIHTASLIRRDWFYWIHANHTHTHTGMWGYMSQIAREQGVRPSIRYLHHTQSLANRTQSHAITRKSHANNTQVTRKSHALTRKSRAYYTQSHVNHTQIHTGWAESLAIRGIVPLKHHSIATEKIFACVSWTSHDADGKHSFCFRWMEALRKFWQLEVEYRARSSRSTGR